MINYNLIIGCACALTAIFILNTRINDLANKLNFVCSMPIVSTKAFVAMKERDGRYVFDQDLGKSFYYVPAGCQ